jgi:hypothetical protein
MAVPDRQETYRWDHKPIKWMIVSVGGVVKPFGGTKRLFLSPSDPLSLINGEAVYITQHA